MSIPAQSRQPLPTTLDGWLAYIEALHPKAIEMGLDRVRMVAKRLHFSLAFPIITIAGTNGKGSTCAMLEAIYLKAGYRVGTYTSPHLLRYNERIRVNQQVVSDAALCHAFAEIEAVRDDIPLTYFEYGTLAAMWHFQHAKLDVAVLEIGMGGRLDAVNAFDADCAIVTGVDLDHMEYLGDSREKIALEKAGIYRPQRPAICGDDNPPQSLLDYAQSIGAHLQLIHRDFDMRCMPEGLLYQHEAHQLSLPLLGLHGDFQRNNAACALCAVDDLQDRLPVKAADIVAALATVQLVGRYQRIHKQPDVIVDVAHNPQAARSLRHILQASPCTGRTLAVFAMLADKDIDGVISELASSFSAWYVADIHNVRGAKAGLLAEKLLKFALKSTLSCYESVELAARAAYKDAAKNDRIIIFGSFYTVADAIGSPAFLSDTNEGS